MSSDESKNPESRPNESPDEDWGDAWDGGGASDKGGRPSDKANRPEAAAQTPDRSIPEGIEDFKAAAEAEQSKPQAKRVERMQPREVTLETVSVDRQGIEEKEWSNPTVFSAKWVTLITLSILAVIIACLVLMQRSGPVTKGSTKSKPSEKEQIFEALEAELKDLHGRMHEARKLYADFASARVVEEILPMIRNSGQLRDVVRRTGHQTLVDKEWEPGLRAVWMPHILRGIPQPFATLSGELPDFTNYRAYFVIEGGFLLLDWKATTAYSTASFADLSQGKGDGSEIRGFLKPASLYTDVWPEDQYHCYLLESPDRLNLIWCYVKRSSDEAKEVGRFFLKGEILEERETKLPMTLKLSRGPEGSLPNQWRIDGLHHEEWINMR